MALSLVAAPLSFAGAAAPLRAAVAQPAVQMASLDTLKQLAKEQVSHHLRLAGMATPCPLGRWPAASATTVASSAQRGEAARLHSRPASRRPASRASHPLRASCA